MNISKKRICKFLPCNENEIDEMYLKNTIETSLLLRWSKLLEYDFFRIYSQHLILYAPPSAIDKNKNKTQKSEFRKNIYTPEIKDFILERINSGEMTKVQVLEIYKIPKTTLFKWITKSNI